MCVRLKSYNLYRNIVVLDYVSLCRNFLYVIVCYCMRQHKLLSWLHTVYTSVAFGSYNM